MSKLGYFSRYITIIKKLKAKPCSFSQLEQHLQNRIDYLQEDDDSLNIGLSKRTLQRDFREIKKLFGIDIEYSKREKGYHIANSEMDYSGLEILMESYDIFKALNIAQDIAPFVFMDKRNPQNTDNLFGLLHAIKNKQVIHFDYQKFWDEAPTARASEPYLLKEFRNRWYIIVKDLKDAAIKTFALDRLTNLDIRLTKFSYSDADIIIQNFRYCFGIISPNATTPDEIILSFDPFQGKYVKSLPLHATQQILADNEDELRIKLQLFITYDFIKELLSYGDNVKVIKPSSLAKEIKAAHQKAFEQYSAVDLSKI